MKESEWGPLAFDITDEASLVGAGEVLHDALFSLDDTAYDEEAGVFSLTAWREVPELARRERLLRIVPLPFVRAATVRAVLTLRGVRAATIEEQERWGEYCLTDVSYHGGEGCIRLDVTPPLTMELEVERIEGRLEDIGEPSWERPGILTIG